MIRKYLLRTFVYCLITTVIIATGLSYNEPAHWFENLLSSLIFSMSIGYSIHFLIIFFSPRIAKFPSALRQSLLLALFLVGGVVGTEIGLGIQRLIFHFDIAFSVHVRLLTLNLVLAALFGTVAVVYFTLKENAEQMAAKLIEKELNEERLIRMKMEAEIQALQAKINPHFLFNTLNSIASLISENPKAAEATVEKLSELFRYTLKNAEKNTVSLAEELDIVRTYLEIEKVRFGDRLQYDIACDAAVGDFRIPALIIQPLVENSIKHGIATELRGGTIHVKATQTGKECLISVVDDGKGFDETKSVNGFGLRSIEERLQLLYGESASLRIVPDSRTHFLITIPIS